MRSVKVLGSASDVEDLDTWRGTAQPPLMARAATRRARVATSAKGGDFQGKGNQGKGNYANYGKGGDYKGGYKGAGKGGKGYQGHDLAAEKRGTRRGRAEARSP